MLNEFEKQVQQKMEELKFVPSEPVWQKVEMQIRKKKDRRKLAFWIPFLTLLLGGGLWIGIGHYLNPVASDQAINKEYQQKKSLATPAEISNQKNGDNNENNIRKINTDRPGNKNDIASGKTKNTAVHLRTKPVSQEKASQKIKAAREILEKKEKTVFTETNPSGEIGQLQEQKRDTVDSTVKTNQGTDTSHIISADKKRIETNSSKIDSLKTADTIKRSDTKKHALSKWKLNLVASSGMSGLNRLDLFNLFDGEKSLSASPLSNSSGSSSTGGTIMYYSPSPIKKGFSFSAGAIAEKKLTNRVSFSTGLRYNYYSNTIDVGTVVNQNRMIMDFMVTQYYSNRSTVTQPYRNQYHFVSIPATIKWQLFKKHPFNFSTGLSLQYLIKTNALRFDYGTQTYFHSNSAFNKMHLLSEFGFDYSISLKQKPFTVGPQFQYELSRLEKGNATNHLFSYGLRAQWQLNKK